MAIRVDATRLVVVERLRWQLLGNGYRAYNTALMRFHSPDDMSPFGAGGVNAYAYCGGDPVNASDPSGHFLPTALLGLATVAAGGAAVAFSAHENQQAQAVSTVIAGVLGVLTLVSGAVRAAGRAGSTARVKSSMLGHGDVYVNRSSEYTVVSVHGVKGGYSLKVGTRLMDGHDFSDYLSRPGTRPLGDKPIVLDACYGGYGDPAPAQLMSNYFGQKVFASPGPTGNAPGRPGQLQSGQWVMFEPQHPIAGHKSRVKTTQLRRRYEAWIRGGRRGEFPG